MSGVITASEPSWIAPFTGLSARQFSKLVNALRREDAEPGRQGPDVEPAAGGPGAAGGRVLAHETDPAPTGPAVRGVEVGADRVIDHLGPSLALQQRRRFRKDAVLIVDGTLVPTRDHTIAEQSKNYRYSTNHQVVIDADSQLVVAVGRPLPGNRNDCKACAKAAVGRATVIADGCYRGTGLLIPHRRERGQTELPAWKEKHNTSHVRDCRLKGDGVHTAMLGTARLHNLALAG